jgi:hypothetical protein
LAASDASALITRGMAATDATTQAAYDDAVSRAGSLFRRSAAISPAIKPAASFGRNCRAQCRRDHLPWILALERRNRHEHPTVHETLQQGHFIGT